MTVNQGMVDLIRGDNIQMRPIDWLWDGWLARGKLHILAGSPGTGKTTIALALGAALTCGSRWPDGAKAWQGDVLIWSGEDDPADTLAPRLKAMGADMGRVHFIGDVKSGKESRSFDPATDIPALAKAVETICPALLIVDPIVSAVSGDSHKNTETRRALQPLVDLASKVGAAVLGITHFSKGSAGRNPVERVTGSLAFGALARIVLCAAKTEDGASRILCRSKSNIGFDGGGFRYGLEQRAVPDNLGLQASCVVFGEAVQGAAHELLGTAESTAGDNSLLEAAKQFLEIELKDGPQSAKVIKKAAEHAGYSVATIRRAQKELGIKAEKISMTEGWRWILPKVLKDHEGAQAKGMGIFDTDEHLQDEGGLFDEVI